MFIKYSIWAASEEHSLERSEHESDDQQETLMIVIAHQTQLFGGLEEIEDASHRVRCGQSAGWVHVAVGAGAHSEQSTHALHRTPASARKRYLQSAKQSVRA